MRAAQGCDSPHGPAASQGAAVPLCVSPPLCPPPLWWVQPGGADGCRQKSPSPLGCLVPPPRGPHPVPAEPGPSPPHQPPPRSELRPASSLQVWPGRHGGPGWVVLCRVPPQSPLQGGGRGLGHPAQPHAWGGGGGGGGYCPHRGPAGSRGTPGLHCGGGHPLPRPRGWLQPAMLQGGAGLGRVPDCLGGLSRGCHTHATVPPVPQFPLCSQSPKGGRRARPSPGRVAPWTGHRVPSQTGQSPCPRAGWTPCPRAGLLSRLRPSSPVAATGLAHIPALGGSPVSPATRPERGPSPRLTPGMSHVQHACACVCNACVARVKRGGGERG